MGAVYSLAVLKHKDVEMLASGSDRDIILWAAKGWKKLKTLQGPIILAPPAFFFFICLYRRQFDNLRERMLWWGAPSPTRSSSWLRSSGIYAHMLMLNNAQHVLMTSHFFNLFFPGHSAYVWSLRAVGQADPGKQPIIIIPPEYFIKKERPFHRGILSSQRH